jgi:hypothetical protein
MGILESIAAIAGAVTALIGVGYSVAKLYREAQTKGWIEDGRDLAKAIAEAKTEDERRKLARALFNHRAE